MSSLIEKALENIVAIERIVEPYGYYPDGDAILKDLAAIKELLKNPTRGNLLQALEKLKAVENIINQYGGYEPSEKAIEHINILKEMAKRHGL